MAAQYQRTPHGRAQPSEQVQAASEPHLFPANDLRSLSAPGVLGFFTHFEVTEVVAFFETLPPVNVFSIAVAEERSEPQTNALQWLGSRLTVKGMKGAKFGVCRYTRTVNEVLCAVDEYLHARLWQLSGHPLRTQVEKPMLPQFVPPDSSHSVTINKVLKNNFWDGCYVVEMFDHLKADVKGLLANPQGLMELSEKISALVPISLASVSDRIGNMIFQLPVNVVRAKTTSARVGNVLTVELAWHPNAVQRPLALHCITEFDKIVSGFNAISVREGDNKVPMGTLADEHRVVLWDATFSVILSASRPSSFVSSVAIGIAITSPEPRIFTSSDGQERRIGLSTTESPQIVGEAPMPHKDWVLKRIYAEEAATLAAQRRFKQYLPQAGAGDQDHWTALGDLHYLMQTYGEESVCLWDPYLSAHDILETLFFNVHAGAHLRALSSAQRARKLSGEESVQKWIGSQRLVFTDCQSNYEGLNLEYRTRYGEAGWDFHDRFLIFPNTKEGSLAWSLGISVNQFGKSHHILQRVDNGRLIVEAFQRLWDELASPGHVVWKWPLGRGQQ